MVYNNNINSTKDLLQNPKIMVNLDLSKITIPLLKTVIKSLLHRNTPSKVVNPYLNHFKQLQLYLQIFVTTGFKFNV